MLVLSFNARGLGSSPKIKALKRMIDRIKLMIIFIQEIMMEGEKSKEVLEPWLKGWSFGFISYKGHSGGLITSWNEEYEKSREEKHSSMLKTVLKEKSSGKCFVMYNVYGPYHDQKGFWEEFFTSGLTKARNVILGGDLNLSLSKKEN